MISHIIKFTDGREQKITSNNYEYNYNSGFVDFFNVLPEEDEDGPVFSVPFREVYFIQRIDEETD